MLEITVDELKQKLESGIKLVDVREPWEYEICHIKDSKLIPLSQLPSKISDLNKKDDIVLYCHTQNRSRIAAQFLVSNGFTNVRFLSGGIDEWAQKIEPDMARY